MSPRDDETLKELIAMTDWNKETEQLGSSNFWKPDTGSHKVLFLDNGRPSQYRDAQGRVTDQVNFKIEVDEDEKIWTVTKAKTVNSLYGQIALLGRYHGSLEGKTITLLVKFDRPNNKREYTVKEALPLIEEWNTKSSKNKKESPDGDSVIDEIFGKYGHKVKPSANI
jgi:hypothetical protein